MPNLRNGSKGGFEPGLTRLRVRHSTTELPRSTQSDCVGRVRGGVGRNPSEAGYPASAYIKFCKVGKVE